MAAIEVTELSICNQALVALGANTLEVFGEDTKNGRLCTIMFNQTKNSALTDHIWGFAQKRFALIPSTVPADPVWTDDLMTEIYDKPTDCLKANFTNIESAIVKIEGDKILSNEPGLKIKYTEEIIDVTKFFPKFIEALVGKLAAELAYAVTSSRTLAEGLFKLYYDTKLPKAVSLDSQQGTPQGVAQDSILISRMSGGSTLIGRAGFETWYPVC